MPTVASSTRKELKDMTLTSRGLRSRVFNRSALDRFPDSLLHTAHGCLGPDEKQLDLDVPWMTAPLLDALVDAHTTGKLLIPLNGSGSDVERLLHYARLPVEALPVGLRRNLESKRLVDEMGPQLAATIAAKVEDEPAGTWSATYRFEDLDWLPKIKSRVQLVCTVVDGLAAHGISAFADARLCSTALEISTSW